LPRKPETYISQRTVADTVFNRCGVRWVVTWVVAMTDSILAATPWLLAAGALFFGLIPVDD
jgi:hypothetical protein